MERIVAFETDIADLVVIARPASLDGRDALRATLFKARRILLGIPPDIPIDRAPPLDHVAIGWKSGAQAERMVEAALPWLQRAGGITVLSVRRIDGRRYDPDARPILRGCRFLSIMRKSSEARGQSVRR